MNKLKAIILALTLIAIPSTISAQFSYGIRAGIALDNLVPNETIIDVDNRVGFTAGLMGEFIAPVLGFGIDASLLYRYSGSTITYENVTEGSNNYLDIPINLKWRISIPAVGKLIAPIIFTGPSFSVLLNKNEIVDAWENKTFNTSWNIGAGAVILSKVQVSIAYNIGISNSLDVTNVEMSDLSDISLKNNHWDISLVYLF